MKIFITGGSGFVGTHLSRHLLEKGHNVIGVGTASSHRSIRHENFAYVSADTTKEGSWQDRLEDVDAVINLAGRTIFKRWSDAYKKQIYNSRILTTRYLVKAIPAKAELTFCSASAVGYYGDRGDEILNEKSSSGDNFLARVSLDWEKEAFRAEEKGVRVAVMRFGVVLGKGGGALEKMVPAFKFFAGGPLGSGIQWFPWIHMEDLISAIIFIIEDHELRGPVNFCSPNPVRHRDFAKALGKVLKRPSSIKTPSFIIQAIMGEMGTSLINSQRVIPDTLLKHGFQFRYPDIKLALYDIVE